MDQEKVAGLDIKTLALLPPVVITTWGGTVLFLNNTAEKLLNTSDGKGKSTRSLFHVSKEVEKKIITQKESVITFEHKTKKHTHYLKVTTKPLLKEKKLLLIVQDVTERKQEEEYRDFFVGIVSHELKTPLASIKAYAELLEMKNKQILDEKSLGYLKRIHGLIYTQTRLINELLDLTKIKAGTMQYTFEKVSLDDLLKDTVEEIQQTTLTHHITLRGKSGVSLTMDKVKIKEVLSNLIINAIKYAPEKDEVVVEVLENEKEVTVRVIDQGIGIAPEHQKQIFDPYFQGRQRKKKKSSTGLGVGLYICAEIIKNHRGTIWVESHPGKGSTFSFNLPKSITVREKRQKEAQTASL